jgi:hypothetical protein
MTETKTADGSTTMSSPLSDMTLEQLVQVSQGLGHQIEKLREQRAHLKAKIAERLAAGERTSVELAPGDAAAPGAVIEPTME